MSVAKIKSQLPKGELNGLDNPETGEKRDGGRR